MLAFPSARDRYTADLLWCKSNVHSCRVLKHKHKHKHIHTMSPGPDHHRFSVPPEKRTGTTRSNMKFESLGATDVLFCASKSIAPATPFYTLM
jgi:hypothetical protein